MNSESSKPLSERIAAAPKALRKRVLVNFITEQLAEDLGEEVGPFSRFEELGVDSRRALEIKELLEEELDCYLQTTLLFDYPTTDSLANFILDDFATQN